MKRFIYNIAIAAGVVLGMSSCEGFLDRVPTESVVAENAMVTMADAKVAANGLYTDLKYYNMYGTYMICLGDMRADNLYPRELNGSFNSFYTHNFSASQTNYFGIWQNYYNIIMKASTFIKNVNSIPVENSSDEAVRDDLMGQAYAVRALCYFDLARIYGYPYLKDNGASLGAVILDHDNENEGIVSPEEAKEMTRSSVADTYAQAMSDVQAALSVLSKDKNTGHFNYWAAKMLQGKMALYKGDYQLAYTANKEVIDNSPYRLVPNEDYIAYWSVEGDAESVLEFLVSPDGDIDGDGGFNTIYHSLWFESTNAGRSVIPTKKWMDLFKDTPDDVRAQFIKENDPKASGVTEECFWLKKFTGNKQWEALTFRQNNPRIFRITDAYLMAAEAALQVNQAADADKYLNAVRMRADKTAKEVTATQDLIMLERHKEFIGEGHRFFDVMRTGGQIVRDMSVDVRDYDERVIDWNNHLIVLPISDTEFTVHPKLQQNPGY